MIENENNRSKQQAKFENEHFVQSTRQIFLSDRKENLFAKQTTEALDSFHANCYFTFFCFLPQVNKYYRPMPFYRKNGFKRSVKATANKTHAEKTSFDSVNKEIH